MTSSDEEFHQWLLATFREEADEILGGISQGLIELEKTGSSPAADLIEVVYRKTHSLKGAARAVDLRDIESICQNAETLFSLMKRGELTPDAELFDLLHSAIAAITSILAGEKNAGLGGASVVLALRDRADRVLAGKGSSGLSATGEDSPALRRIPDSGPFPPLRNPEEKGSESAGQNLVPGSGGDAPVTTRPASALVPGVTPGSQKVKDGGTVRIASHKLDRLISGSDDLLTIRLFITHRMRELEEMMSSFSLWRWNHTQIEGDLNQIREASYGILNTSLPPEIMQPLGHIIEFLKFDRDFVTTLQHDLAVHIRATEVDRSALESSTHEISDLIHDAVLVPVSIILTPFSKFVREYSRSAGKIVDFSIEGEEIEMDRRILQAIKTPLMHLIHNSIDHGIEYPDIRTGLGKPSSGKVQIRVSTHSGSKVAIEVIDDGAGIDRRQIRQAAVDKGVITEKQETNITDDEAIWLIFRSGLSTNTRVTDLSGRGLGLAIVDDTVTRLGGELTVSSEAHAGTTITIILPVRLATLRGVVVRSGSQTYVFPIQQVKKVIRLDPAAVVFQGSRATTRIEGEVLRVIRLSEILRVPDTGSWLEESDPIPLVILEYAGQQIACVVDEVISVQEIVVRPLGSLLRRVRQITGAVILGDGSVAMVLDPLEIIQDASFSGRRGDREQTLPRRDKHVLVVDDSATSRALLRRTLELSGYQVHTASDGMDAFAKMRLYFFDLIVSDVDMPRMNGYTLTEKIRSDERFSGIPVLLVTSLDSAEDREYGRMVGASAYIVKSQFEKRAFLEVIHSLLYNAG